MTTVSLPQAFAAWPAEAPASLIDPIRYRRSIRGFSSRPVPPEALLTILEAARWAASCYGEEPWRYIVTTQGDGGAHEKLLATLMEANRAWVRHAPVLLLTLAKKDFTHNGKPNLYAVHDAGIALGALSIQATALGLALHPMAGFDHDAARAAFQIDANYEVLAAVALGYPGDGTELNEAARAKEFTPRQRKPLNELVLAGLPRPALGSR
jgi:nitroreductase